MPCLPILKRLVALLLVMLPLSITAPAQDAGALTCKDLQSCLALVLIEDPCDPTCEGYVPEPYIPLEGRFRDFGRAGVDALIPLLQHKHEMVRNKAAYLMRESPYLAPTDAPAILKAYRDGNSWLTFAIGRVASDAELSVVVAEGLATPSEEFGQILESMGARAEPLLLSALDCANLEKCGTAVASLATSLSYQTLKSPTLSLKSFDIADNKAVSPKARRLAVALALRFLLGQDVYRNKPDDWAFQRLKKLQQDSDADVSDAALDFLVRYKDPDAIAALALAEAKAAKYFPMNVYSEYPRQHSFIEKWYGKHLVALKEPSLFPAKESAEIFRFTWLRTFHNPMVFRIDIGSNGSATLLVRRTNGAGGYEPGVLDLEKTINLDKPTVEKIRIELKTSGFWSLDPTKPSEGTDGAQWIFEANQNGQYRLVDRWSGGEMQGVGLALIKLSGVDVGDIY